MVDINERKFCVYKHTSPSGKVYIGITCQKPEERWREGKGYPAIPMKNAIEKYGWDNFLHEILFTNLTLEEANQKEIETIAEFDSTNPKKGYNITLGGNCRFIGENHPLYGKKRPKEVVEKIAAAKRGKPISKKHREALKKYYKTHKAWNYGIKTPPEVIEKLRKSHLGQRRPHNEETIRKISDGNQRFKKAVFKCSLSGEKIEKYESVSAAARSIDDKKCTKENIRQCCYGLRRSAHGYCWIFAEGGIQNV